MSDNDPWFKSVLESAVPGLDLGLEVFEKALGKLTIHPDPAAKHLAAVLSQLQGMYSSLDEALSQYGGIMLWPDMPKGDYAQRFAELARLSPGSLTARFAESRPHCTMIQNIYQRFLRNWFQRVVSPDEQGMLEHIFVDKMQDFDDALVRSLDMISNWLGNQALTIKHAMTAEDWQQIDELLKTSQPKAARLQEELAGAWRQLASLRAAFIKATGAIEAA